MNFKKALTKKVENAVCNKSTSASSIAIALIGGIAVGTLVSLLFAPQSGEDTRNMIADKSKELKDSMKEQLKNLKGKMRDMQDQAGDLADNAREKMNTAKQSVNNAVKQSTSMS